MTGLSRSFGGSSVRVAVAGLVYWIIVGLTETPTGLASAAKQLWKLRFMKQLLFKLMYIVYWCYA